MKSSLLALALLPVLCSAQIPDVQIKLDLRGVYRTQPDGTSFRGYDALGRHSLVSLQLQLEPGLRLFVGERLEKIRGDGDPDQIDESYVEEPGSWRIGKQVLPFGGGLLRESVLGARSDSSVFVRSLPLRLAVFDGGTGRPRGICGRVGRNIAASFMIGEHFGVSSTSLSLLRHPEEAGGVGGGYRRAFSVDFRGRQDVFQIGGEALFLRDHSITGQSESILDLTASLAPSKYQSVTIGYTRPFVQGINIFRLQGTYLVYNGVTVEPLFRIKDGVFYDFSIALRLKF